MDLLVGCSTDWGGLAELNPGHSAENLQLSINTDLYEIFLAVVFQPQIFAPFVEQSGNQRMELQAA